MSARNAGVQVELQELRLVQLSDTGDELVGEEIERLKPAKRRQRTFLDSNILVYADDRHDPVKQRKAVEVIREQLEQRTGVVSLQVLQEYFVNVTKKQKLDAEIARHKVEIYSRFSVAEPAVSDVLAAIDLYRFHGFSFWDALIVRMAKQSGCRLLLSEDMQHGRIVDGVEIVNPFL
jgi:predicted nucleic acid-binding protein